MLKGEPRRLTFLKRNSYSPAGHPADGGHIIFTSGVLGSYCEVSGSYRLPASGNRSGCHLALERVYVPGRLPQRQPAGIRTWAGSTPTYGVSRCRAREWLAAPQSGSFPPHARIWLHNTLPTASGLLLNPSAVESIAPWVSDADGSDAAELLPQAGANCSAVRWSPDGQRVAFDSDMEGNFDAYVVRARGGKPIRLTTDSADDVAPSWSRDGKWVYFTSRSDRSIRGVEGIGRRRGGYPGDPEWRRDSLRVTRRQVHLLHERRLFRQLFGRCR